MMSETVRFFAVQTTLIAAVLVLHTYLGLHIVRRSLVFSDLVLDQLAAFGALVGISVGIQYGSGGSYAVSMVAVIFGSVLLAVIKPRNKKIPREAVIGIMYGLVLVGCLLLCDKLNGGDAYVTKTLSGSMLWVTWPLVGVTVVVYLGLLLFHYRFREKFIGLAEKNKNMGNERLWDFLLFFTQGIITVLIVPIAGVLLAYAFLMIPAAIAAMFTVKWAGGVLLGWVVGFTACVMGLILSYFYNLPYGPTLILSMGAFFIVAVIVRCLIPRNI